ncbi:MAG: hypothetical protein AAF215_13585 [Cyanobacteria bacterium P01_A01_bin.123]
MLHRHHPCCRKRVVRNSLLLFFLWITALWTLYDVRYSNMGGTAQYQKLQRLAWYGVVLKANQP